MSFFVKIPCRLSCAIEPVGQLHAHDGAEQCDRRLLRAFFHRNIGKVTPTREMIGQRCARGTGRDLTQISGKYKTYLLKKGHTLEKLQESGKTNVHHTWIGKWYQRRQTKGSIQERLD